MNQQGPKAVKIEHKRPIRTYAVKDNGQVVVNETIDSEILFDGREFLSYLRQHEERLNQVNYQLGDEFKEKLEKDKEELEKAIEDIKIFIPKVEENLKKEYEKQKLEGARNMIKTSLENKEVNESYVYQVWSNLTDVNKKVVRDNLDSELQDKLDKILLKIKKAEKKK